MHAYLLAITLLLVSGVAFGQPSAPPPPASASPPVLSEVDTYVKVVGAALTAAATLLGLPIALLTYRKTRAEITKLELEARALREKQAQQAEPARDEEGNIRILVDRSPNTSIQVLADPRFLAPLLVLLDFIFAWIVLTLVGHLLSIFSVGVLRTPAIAVLAALLLLPIARQVLRVRAALRPARTPEEIRASQRQSRIAGYTLYAISILTSLVLGALLLTVSPANLTDLGRYFAWGLILSGAILVLALPIAKRRFDRYLSQLHEADTR